MQVLKQSYICIVFLLFGMIGLYSISQSAGADDFQVRVVPVVDMKKAGACCALFSPNDDITGALCDCIDKEKKQILVLMYTFTSKPLAEALLRAHNRKVAVTLLVDRSCVNDRYNKVEYLASQGVPVFVYDPVIDLGKETNGLMHNKCAIFVKNIGDKSIVATGSFNYTQSAGARNHENVVLLNDTAVVAKYISYFEALKKKTMPLARWREQRPVIYNNLQQYRA